LPNFDLFDVPGYTLRCGELNDEPNYKPCNWLHLIDNFVDPLHEEILHSNISGIQSRDPNGRPLKETTILGEGEFVESPTGIITLDMRRVRDFVWVRNIEYIWPNIALLGRLPEWPPEFSPDEPEFHGIPTLVDWAVPMDDEQTMEFGLVLVPEGQENRRVTKPSYANRGPRPYEEMQRWPGDYEAQIGQRTIAVHGMEHLGQSDKGVTMMRKGLRQRMRMVQQGQDPPELKPLSEKMVVTYAGDTLLRADRAATPDGDKELIKGMALEMGKRYVKDPPNLPDRTP
jgi:hypothetical protein